MQEDDNVSIGKSDPIEKIGTNQAGNARALLRSISQHRGVLLMMLPGLVLLFLFRYLPMFGIVIAFKDYKPWDGIWASPWVGLRYITDALAQSTFRRAFGNTVLLSFMNLLAGFPAPIILALLLNEVRHKFFKRAVQTISYLPFFISWVIISAFLYNMLSSDYGYLNNVLAAIGLPEVDWYYTTGIWRYLLVILGIWKGVGWGTILYLAAITGISAELYEAAVIDGCGRFKRVLHITLPGIAPTAVVVLILSTGGLVSGNFEQIWSILGTNLIIRPEVDIIDTFVYRVGLLESKYSFAAAVGLFRSIISIGLVLTANKLSARFQREENYTLF